MKLKQILGWNTGRFVRRSGWGPGEEIRFINNYWWTRGGGQYAPMSLVEQVADADDWEPFYESSVVDQAKKDSEFVNKTVKEIVGRATFDTENEISAATPKIEGYMVHPDTGVEKVPPVSFESLEKEIESLNDSIKLKINGLAQSSAAIETQRWGMNIAIDELRKILNAEKPGIDEVIERLCYVRGILEKTR